MRSESGARARKDTVRSRAASGIMLAGTTAGAGGAFPGLGPVGAGNARLANAYWRPRPRKPGLKLSERGESPLARAAVERREASPPPCLPFLFEHDLFRKPVATFRDHAASERGSEGGAASADADLKTAPFGASLPSFSCLSVMFRKTVDHPPDQIRGPVFRIMAQARTAGGAERRAWLFAKLGRGCVARTNCCLRRALSWSYHRIVSSARAPDRAPSGVAMKVRAENAGPLRLSDPTRCTGSLTCIVIYSPPWPC